MTDIAYQNAQRRRDDIARHINHLQDELGYLKTAYARVVQFISDWEEFAGTANHTEQIQNESPPDSESSVENFESRVSEKPKREPLNNPPKERIASFARALIETKGAPVSRNALFAALENDGLTIRGTDPKMVLSTTMWRLSKPNGEFVRLGKLGYWLRDRSYAAGGYTPGVSNGDEFQDQTEREDIEIEDAGAALRDAAE